MLSPPPLIWWLEFGNFISSVCLFDFNCIWKCSTIFHMKITSSSKPFFVCYIVWRQMKKKCKSEFWEKISSKHCKILQSVQNKICCFQIHHSEYYTQLNIMCFLSLKRSKDCNKLSHKINQFDYIFVRFLEKSNVHSML